MDGRIIMLQYFVSILHIRWTYDLNIMHNNLKNQLQGKTIS